MRGIERLYSSKNTTLKKSVNLEDNLYEELKKLTETKYDASISELVNVILEDYISKDEVFYHGKAQGISETYRSMMFRKENLDGLSKLNKKHSISFTRLVNGAIKEFLKK